MVVIFNGILVFYVKNNYYFFYVSDYDQFYLISVDQNNLTIVFVLNFVCSIT